MAGGRYSLDDILNEYPKSGKKTSGSDVDLNDIIDGYEKKEKESVSLHNTDMFSAGLVQPDLSDVNFSLAENPVISSSYKAEDNTEREILAGDYGLPSGAANEARGSCVKTAVKEILNKNIELSSSKQNKKENEFEDKYQKLSQVSSEKKFVQDDELPPAVSIKKEAPSFSESFEDNVISSEEEYHPLIRKAPPKVINDISEKTGPFSFLNRKNDDSNENRIDEDIPAKPDSYTELYKQRTSKLSNTFEKYSSSEGMDINSILDEYASNHVNKKNEALVKTETSPIKGLTDIFSKLNRKSESSEPLDGNTELLDGMMKIKKDRVHKTALIPPISRKSISDIDLKLDDKILPDTAQIPVNEEQAEIDKFNALKQRRNEKIKDFVFVGDEEENDDEAEAEETIDSGVIDDFDKLEDAPSIANDIAQLKRSLSIRLFVLIICLALSGYVTLVNDFSGLPMFEFLNKRTETTTFLFINSVIGIIAAFMSYTVISCGLSKLFTLRADCDSLTAVAVVSSLASSMIFLANTNLVRESLIHDYVPVAIAVLMFNTIGKLLIVNRTQRNFKYVSGDSEKYAIIMVHDEEKAQTFTRGALSDFPSLAASRKTEFIPGFLKTSYSSDSTDKFCKLSAPIIIAAALLISILSGIISQNEFGIKGCVYIAISVFVGCISICSTFSMMLVVNLPMERASGKYREMNGAMLGYDSIEEFSETNSVLIDATQLFPQGSVKLSAIKIFSDTRIDEAIVEAASLTSQSNSILKNMFYDIIAGKTELLNPVESYIFEDSIGLCGWINNKRILLGNRELMINHSIEGMPTAAKEKEYTENGKTAVYLSISGELSAMFVIELTTTLEVQQALQEMERNNIYIMVRSVDSAISISRLSEMFDISPEIFKMIPFRNHETFEEVTSYQANQPATLACSGRFAAFSALILGAKRLRGTINVGIGMQAISILLGILITAALVILKSFGDLSVSVIMAYNLVFTLILLLFQSFRKY